MKRETLVERYVEAIDKGNAAVFAGAGLSMSQGYVSWSKLLEKAAIEIGLDVKKETDLITIAQYYKNEQGGNRGRIDEILIQEFGKKVKISKNHEILASLPIETYWTTNYDHLIEDSIKQMKKNPSVKTNSNQLAKTMPDVDATIYKMHGDITNVSETIITRDDYEKYDETYTLFKEALKGNLLTKTFLFLGFSFTDSNLERILTDIRWALKDSQRPHYCIIKKINKDDFMDETRNFDEKQYEYDKVKRKLQVQDLKRFSINVLEVENYTDITNVLEDIKNIFLKKTIFISGSAVDYTPMTKEFAEEFVEKLSYRLVEKKYRIVSGFGLGIGSLVVNGVLKQKKDSNMRKIDNALILKPFPQHSKIEWTAYREEMIQEAGIIIFIFGNKEDEKIKGKNIILANGMEEEFEIAMKQGKIVIPIGYTGSKSLELFTRVKKNIKEYYPKNISEKDLDLFAEMDNKKSIGNLIEEIVSFIEKI